MVKTCCSVVQRCMPVRMVQIHARIFYHVRDFEWSIGSVFRTLVEHRAMDRSTLHYLCRRIANNGSDYPDRKQS